jgi:tRNA A-37 threonylcarbamoyl transferase component Bud32
MNEGRRTYCKRTAGGLAWTYREGLEGLTALDFAREMPAGASENMVRIRGRLAAGGRGYFVKIFKHVGFGRSLKSLLFGHVAKKEFAASCYLASRGIRTPEAIAVGLSRNTPDHAIIIFREIAGAVPVQDLFLKAESPVKERYLDLIARTTAALHRASFYHRDYHAGNLMLETDGPGAGDLWVIDLHRSSFPRDMFGRRGPKNIADIIHSLLPAVGQDDISRFLARYREENPAARWDEAAARRSIESRLIKIEERRLRSRTKRCFVNSSGFVVTRDPGRVVYARREISPEEITRVIGRFTRGEGRQVKKDKKATIALVRGDRGELCVKAYEHFAFSDLIKALMGRSRGHDSWRAAHALLLRGFTTPRALCLVIRRRFFIPRAAYLVTESIAPRVEMARFILRNLEDGPHNAAARFVTDFASVIGSLHRAGVYHRDLKTSNIAVGRQGEGFSISFLDLDAVSFGTSVSAAHRAKNLAQIFLSTPQVIGAEHRQLFFKAYTAASGRPEDSRVIARLVGDLVKGRVIRYVSDAGDVVEDAGALYTQLWGDD